jgi:hypothetical protein
LIGDYVHIPHGVRARAGCWRLYEHAFYGTLGNGDVQGVD